MFFLAIITDFFCYYLLSESFDWAVAVGAFEAGIATIGISAVSLMMVRSIIYNNI